MPRKKKGQSEEGTRVIKRYQNRKLYDTRESRYVTLDDIADMIKRGEELVVKDKRTGRDLTALTLAQIIFEQQKKSREFLPLSSLRRLIQSGGASIQEIVGKGVASFQQSRGEIEQFLGQVLNRGKQITPDEGLKVVQDVVTQVQKGIEDVQTAFEERARLILARLRSFSSLQKEIEDLEKRVVELEELLAEAHKRASKK